MFKKASDNAQSRTDRNAEFSRHNEAGADPSAFATHPKSRSSMSMDALERERILCVNRKQDLEEKMSLCRLQIDRAERAFRDHSENKLSQQLYQKLLNDRDDITARLFQANKEVRANNLALSDLRRVEQKPRLKPDRRETFANVFYEIAKEMLATSVVNRITSATIHRIGERLDEKKLKQ